MGTVEMNRKYLSSRLVFLGFAVITLLGGALQAARVVDVGHFNIGAVGLSGWNIDSNNSTIKISVDEKGVSGGKCLKLENIATGAATGTVFSPQVILPMNSKMITSRSIKVTGYFKVENRTAGALNLQVQWAKDLSQNKAVFQNGKGEQVLRAGINDGEKWQSFSFTSSLPVNSRFIRLALNFAAAPGPNRIWLDNIKTTCVDEMKHDISSAFTGNIFPTESGEVKIEIAPGKVIGGEITIADEYGKSVAVTPVKKDGRMTIALPERGFYTIDVNVRYEDGVTNRVCSSAAVIGYPLEEKVRKNSKYGIFTVSMPEKLAVMAGARWNWGFWSIADYKIDATGAILPPSAQTPAQPSQLSKHHAMIGKLPDWLKRNGSANGLNLPNDWDKFFSVVQTWAKNNAKNLELITVYNEPDAGWKGTDEDMVKFHTVTAKAIKSGAPGVKVFGPCLCNIKMSYLRKLCALGLLDNMDGLTLHAYVNGTAPEDEFIRAILEVKEFTRSLGKESLPVHITEFGWTSQSGTWQKPVDEITQARYAARSLALISTTGIDSAIYFCGFYSGKGNAGERAFSVCNADLTPRASYASLAMAIKSLAPLGTHGRWLKITPNVNLVMHDVPNGNTLLIAWSQKGDGTMQIPARITSLRDMVGRKLVLPENGKPLILSPSPVYLETSDNFLCRMKTLPPTKVCASSSVPVPPGKWQIMAPAPLTVTGDKIHVPEGCPFGDYMVFLKGKDSTITGWPLKMTLPLSVKETEVVWPTDSQQPSLRVTIAATVDIAAGGVAVLSVAPDKNTTQPLPEIKSGSECTILFPLNNYTQGIESKAVVSLNFPYNNKTAKTTSPCAFTVITCGKITGTALSANAQPSISSAAWNSFGTSKMTPQDCSAKMHIAYAVNGLYLNVSVTDNEHVQKVQADELWKEDSIQIAFDVDAEKPWQTNNMNYGFNGHRIFEYGAALGEDGTCKIWRWLAYDPRLKSGKPTDVQVGISRKGSVTEYRLFFPWSSLGLDKAPPEGTALGFSLAINDKDKTGSRHGLRLFNGIVDGKDPRTYGRIWFR